jgi:DNA-binding Lrp family transcriptional regulator
MPDHPALGELDLQLLNALQIQPRAPWTVLGSVLGTDASTVSRHWDRLTESGTAWVACEPAIEPATTVALIEIDARPDVIGPISSQLADSPLTTSIDITAGGRDLLALVIARNLDALSHYVVEHLSRLQGVQHLRTHLSISSYTRGSAWRLRALSRDQSARLSTRAGNAAPVRFSQPLDDGDWDIVTALSANGRATTAELATAAGVSTSTAHRRLNQLLASGGLRIRCEIARSASGWPISAWMFLTCPPQHRAATGRALANIPEVRATFSTAGSYNLILALWLRSLTDLETFERQLATKAPHITVADRAVVMRSVKLIGRILDPAGHAAGIVAYDPRVASDGRPPTFQAPDSLWAAR